MIKTRDANNISRFFFLMPPIDQTIVPKANLVSPLIKYLYLNLNLNLNPSPSISELREGSTAARGILRDDCRVALHLGV